MQNKIGEGQSTFPTLLGIEEAAALLAAIVASSTDAILSKTLDGTISSWNAATERLFGYTAAEMIGQSIRRIIPADRQGEEDMILKRIAAGERLDNYETVRVRKDGQLIDVSVTISPVRDPSGAIVGASKIVRDISEKKRAEQQIRVLIKEVNHRAKNMLALVQAIARQTIPPGQEVFLQRFLDRIQALSANQDLLVQNNWRGITVDELIRAQIVPFNGLLGSRVTIEGPPVRLAANAAQAVGMAMHELATNAAKYGSLSNQAGEVTIVWAASATDFSMCWTERRGPAVNPPQETGYGSQVITTMLELSMGAEVSINYAVTGLTWKLSCPIEMAVVRG